MHIGELESILLFVSDLDVAKRFYVNLLRLPTIFEDGIVVVLKTGSGRGSLYIATTEATTTVGFSRWELALLVSLCISAWMTPDGRPVALAKMNRPA